jgi:hypothetical protein
MHAKFAQDLHADAIVSLIGFASEAFVRLQRIKSIVLQPVRANLVCQANLPSLLV